MFRHRRRALLLVLSTLLGLQLVAVAPAAPVAAAETFRIDLASKGDFVAQTNFVQCVGASMQMMLNVMNPKDDRTAKTQLRLQELARDLSGRRGDGRERRGASVRGWMAGLNQLNAGPYRLVGTDTLDEALRLAAAAIRATNRPVGLLVWRGRHAWVMSGFHSTADPRATSDYAVTAAIVMDPLYPYGSKVWGRSPKPREALSPSDLGRQFVPRRQGSIPGGGSLGAAGATMASLSGKYVLVLPYETIVIHRILHVAR
ncbi:MAG TPA: hypothetical protein VFV72_17350 [Candidatus Limnocylindrales bacterium]|nr:hypothetical protein [Candidatus Limnocylindrales bacterium]